MEDRERIARDLHDTVIQRLFATGLRLQGAARLAERPEVCERILASVDDLDLTVKHIRTAIFGLEASRRPGGGLRQPVLSLASEAAGALGFEPHILFDGQLDTVAEDRSTELLAVLREALTNVARHAGAHRVEVEVEVDGDLMLRVLDDGRGLGPERRTGAKGLANMEARAARLGGSVLVKPGPEGGTVVEWRVPLQ